MVKKTCPGKLQKLIYVSSLLALYFIGGALVTSVFSAVGFAEGSITLDSYGGSRVQLRDAPSESVIGITPNMPIYVYAEAGDTIYVGSSAMAYGLGGGSGDITWYAPDQSTGNCNTLSKGFIANYTEESAGPDGVDPTNGYEACSFSITSSNDGVWVFDFNAPNPGGGATTPPVSSGGAWTQTSTRGTFLAWDATVVNAADTVVLGRAFQKLMYGALGGGGGVFNAKLYFLTKEGFIYRLDPNGSKPVNFMVFSNNKGYKDADTGSADYDESVYKSLENAGEGAGINQLELPAGYAVHDPTAVDTDSDFTNYIFYNSPDTELPASAPVHANYDDGAQTIRLLGSADTPSNFSYTPSSPTSAAGTFSFDISGSYSYSITIDVNGNGTYTDEDVDIVVTGITDYPSSSTTTYVWDGISPYTNTYLPDGDYDAKLSIQAGEVHFPMLDVEGNDNGFILERLSPATESTIFYDNSLITTNIVGQPSILCASTFNLISGCDTDGVDGSAPFMAWTNSWGDALLLDFWDFDVSGAFTQYTKVTVNTSDDVNLDVDKKVVNVVDNGNGTFTISFWIKVENEGPDNLTDVQVEDNLTKLFNGLHYELVDKVKSAEMNVDEAYDGSNEHNDLLEGGQDLDVNDEFIITFSVLVKVVDDHGVCLFDAIDYSNTAIAKGVSSNGTQFTKKADAQFKLNCETANTATGLGSSRTDVPITGSNTFGVTANLMLLLGGSLLLINERRRTRAMVSSLVDMIQSIL